MVKLDEIQPERLDRAIAMLRRQHYMGVANYLEEQRKS